MTPGAMIFWLGSWVFVLSLTGWAYARVLGAQARREATPDPDDDMTIRERIPPTA